MFKLISALALTALAALALVDRSSASADLQVGGGSGPGAGVTVTESWTNPSASADVRYEGLGEKDGSGNPITEGKRWRQIGDKWTESGTWKANGDDIDSYSDDDELAQTNEGMNDSSNKNGTMEDHVTPPNTGGKWTRT